MYYSFVKRSFQSGYWDPAPVPGTAVSLQDI